MSDGTQEHWYSYSNKMWANAITLSTSLSSEQKLIASSVDHILTEDEIGAMFVWIPRFAYSIPSYNVGRTDSSIRAIDIQFISNSVTGTTTTIDSNTYNIYPAFTFGTSELTGFWFGKFETTGEIADTQTKLTCDTTSCSQIITVKPSYKGVYGTVSSLYYAGRSFATQYGLSQDSHMSKYLEWFAVSYLSNSIYGRCSSSTSCTEITINSNGATYYTGGTNGKNYSTTTGQAASTTGNIYGIYDMNGNQREYVMGVYAKPDGTIISVGNYASGFNGMSYNGTEVTTGSDLPDSKYYDVFTGQNNDLLVYSALTKVNGVDNDFRGTPVERMSDLTSTKNWYSDSAYFVTRHAPWFEVGMSYDFKTSAGAFSSSYGPGYADKPWGFRLVLAD